MGRARLLELVGTTAVRGIGMLTVHLTILAAYIAFALFFDPDAPLWASFVQACLINCLLLPVALLALWRRRSTAARMIARGFEILPAPPSLDQDHGST
jgi:hypothetical protein